jgi:gamma-glutamylcysteine synthetase
MNKSVIRNALYDRYIAPTTHKRERSIGIEMELPIVHMDAQPVNFSVVHRLTSAFANQFHMNALGRDDEGHAYLLEDPEHGDSLSYDCSYNTLEISLGTGRDLFALNERFVTYYRFISRFLQPFRHSLTGMGVNPYRTINQSIPIPNERYRMLYRFLGLYTHYTHPDFFHTYPNFGMFSCASQVQIDVHESELLDTIQTFEKLEPIKALLFSNSVMPEEEGNSLCVRDMLWENSMHGLNPKNIGFYRQDLTSVEDLLGYIQQESMYCVMRNGVYINFTPTPVSDYFSGGDRIGEYWNGSNDQKIVFSPEIEDLQYLRTFKLEDLTYRGTIEFRSCCCQPIRDSMTVAAFHVGLIEMLPKLKELLAQDHVLYGHGQNAEALRKAFCKGIMLEFIDRDQLQHLILSILDLAQIGLERRGKKESVFLKPLYDRADRKTNPATEYLRALSDGVPMDVLIQQYAEID